MFSHILHPRNDYSHYSQYSHYYPSTTSSQYRSSDIWHPRSPEFHGDPYARAYPGHDGRAIPSGYRSGSQQQVRSPRQSRPVSSDVRMHAPTTTSSSQRPEQRSFSSYGTSMHGSMHGGPIHHQHPPHHGEKKKGGKQKFCNCFIAGHLKGIDSRTVTNVCSNRVHTIVPGYVPPMHPEKCLRMTKTSFKSIKLEKLILLAMKLGIRYDDEMTKTEMQNLIAPRLPEHYRSRKFNWTGATATRKHKR